MNLIDPYEKCKTICLCKICGLQSVKMAQKKYILFLIFLIIFTYDVLM
jgi:hypothetical protein